MGYVPCFRLMRRIGPVKTLGVTLLVPGFGTFWGLWFLPERLTGNVLVNMLTILFSVTVVSNLSLGRRRSRVAPRTQPRESPKTPP